MTNNTSIETLLKQQKKEDLKFNLKKTTLLGFGILYFSPSLARYGLEHPDWNEFREKQTFENDTQYKKAEQTSLIFKIAGLSLCAVQAAVLAKYIGSGYPSLISIPASSFLVSSFHELRKDYEKDPIQFYEKQKIA